MSLIIINTNRIIIIKINIGNIERGNEVTADITPKEDICIIFRLLN